MCVCRVHVLCAVCTFACAQSEDQRGPKWYNPVSWFRRRNSLDDLLRDDAPQPNVRGPWNLAQSISHMARRVMGRVGPQVEQANGQPALLLQQPQGAAAGPGPAMKAGGSFTQPHMAAKGLDLDDGLRGEYSDDGAGGWGGAAPNGAVGIGNGVGSPRGSVSAAGSDGPVPPALPDDLPQTPEALSAAGSDDGRGGSTGSLPEAAVAGADGWRQAATPPPVPPLRLASLTLKAQRGPGGAVAPVALISPDPQQQPWQGPSSVPGPPPQLPG